MEKIIILSNIGSTSKKYSIYKDNKESAWFHIEKNGEEFICSSKVTSFFEKKKVAVDIYQNALNYIVEQLISNSLIDSKDSISVVSIRVVIPHTDFVQDMLCNDDVLRKIKTIAHTDPLHINPVIEEIELVQTLLSRKTKIYLISDSGFHSTYNRPIPLPFKTPVYTIGYHGLACESIISNLEAYNINFSKLIIAHLGGGSSVTGVLHKKSVFNSMQFSPLGGMIMSSRSGSVDPLILIEYIKQNNLSLDDALTQLYTKSGLLTLSGISSDLRLIREQALTGNKNAQNTIKLFVDSIVETIMQAVSHTQGIDTLVFSGTIGMRALYIRELVCEKLLWLGLSINHIQNIEGASGCLQISSANSSVKIYVIQIDEMKEMHKHTQIFLEKNKK